MTTLGKILVYLNLLAGMAIVSWSVGLYTQKLGWLDHTNSAGEKVEGEITKLKAEIDALTTEAKIASQIWGAAYARLNNTEAQRDARKAVYAQRLTWARTGDNTGRGFFRDVLYPGSGLINTEQLGPVINGPDGQPLRGADTLTQTIEANNQATTGYLKEIEDLQKQQRAFQTEEKLLQAKLDKHAVFFDHLLNEQQYLESFEVNWLEQLGTVNRRKAQLMNRMMEY